MQAKAHRPDEISASKHHQWVGFGLQEVSMCEEEQEHGQQEEEHQPLEVQWATWKHRAERQHAAASSDAPTEGPTASNHNSLKAQCSI